MRRHQCLQAVGAGLALPGLALPLPLPRPLPLPLSAAPASALSAPPRTLRVAFSFAEIGFDPLQVSDNSSLQVIAHIFASPLTYHPLASSAKPVPLTAAALPEVSADFRRFVFTMQPGIFFADDPAFRGQPRELTAAHSIYRTKRFYDPALRTEHLYRIKNAKILGLSEIRQRALKSRTRFPYDTEVEGLRVLDRYRFEVRLAEPARRFVRLFASAHLAGCVPREVVEAYGADLMAHPVGTGPFMLQRRRRASSIAMVRNPRFRAQVFTAEPPPGAAEAQTLAAGLRGQRPPGWTASRSTSSKRRSRAGWRFSAANTTC